MGTWLGFKSPEILLIIALLTCQVSPEQISKRESTLVGIIEEHAVTLDIKNFYFDLIMMQGHSVTTYTNPKKKELSFSKRNPDCGKEAIVLNSMENQFAIPTPRGGKKRQFVLLKKTPNAPLDKESIPYYASFVYVRNLLPNDSNTHVFDLAGVKTVVEWDVWETRPKGFSPGWDTCDFSLLFTCESLKTMVIKASKELDAEKNKEGSAGKARRKRDLTARVRRQAEPVPLPKPVKGKNPLTPIQGEPGHDPNEYNDLYLDLDIRRIEDVPTKPAPAPPTPPKKVKRSVRVKRFGWPSANSKGSGSGGAGGNGGGGGGNGGGGASGGGGGNGGGGASGGGGGNAAGNGAGNAAADVAANIKANVDLMSALNPLSQLTGGAGGAGNMFSKLAGGLNPAALAKLGAGLGGKGNPLSALTGGLGGLSPDILSKLNLGGLGDLTKGLNVGTDLMANLGGLGDLTKGGFPGLNLGTDLLANLGGLGDLTKGGIPGLNLGTDLLANLGGGGIPGLNLGTDLMANLGGLNPLSQLGNLGGGIPGLNLGTDLMANLGGLNPLSQLGNLGGGIPGLNLGTDLMANLGGLNPLNQLGNLGGMNPLNMLGNLGGMNPMNMLGGLNPMASLGLGTDLLGNLGGLNPLGNLGAGADIMGALNPLSKLGLATDVMANMGAMNPLSALSNLGSITDLSAKTGLGALGPLSMLSGLGGGPLSAFADVGLGVTTNGLGGILGGLTGGKSGPLGMIGGLTSGVLGSSGVLGNLLGPVGSVFGGLGDSIKGLTEGLAGGLVGTLAGDGGIADSLGGLLGGALGATPLGAAFQMLGPVFSVLDPVNAVVATVNGLAQGLPGIGLSLGHQLIGGLAPVIESLGIGGLVESVGLGPVLDTVSGIADSITGTGEALISAWDTVGNGLIEGAAVALTKVGLPPEVAKLAALGSQTAFNVESLKGKGIGLGIRLGSDLIGSTLNGGRHRGAGAGPSPPGFSQFSKFMNTDGVPSNAKTMYGIAYPGAGNGKDFFFPYESLTRAIFKTDIGSLVGFFEPGVPGKYDRFYPDNENDASKYYEQRGKIIPDGFKQPKQDSETGIAGKFVKENVFVPEATAHDAVLHPDDMQAGNVFWTPAETTKKAPKRPTKTADGKNMVYGCLMNGIDQSPHMFVAEGDTLSGFFVPEDPDHPEYVHTPHCVLIPSHPAGHAVIVFDNLKEAENVKEIRGAFFADASNLAVAVSGTINKIDDDGNQFSFVLDRPAVEFVFVKDHPSTKNVWAPFLNGQEWKYVPPPVKPPPPKPEKPEAPPPPPKEKKGGLLNLNVEVKLGASKPKEEYGTKVTTTKTEAFFPRGFAMEGAFIPVDMSVKYIPMSGTLLPDKPAAMWKVVITHRDKNSPKIAAPVACLFVPTGYTHGDALVGALVMDSSQAAGEFKVIDKQKPTEHFWTPGQELWIPAGFADKAAKEWDKSKEGDVPGVSREPAVPPRKPDNYYFGPKFENTTDMTSNVIAELPHEFTYGYVYHDTAAPGPLFIPEVGGVGVFAPGDGGDPQKVYVFPKRPGSESTYIVLATPDSVPDGTAGTFHTATIDGKISEQFVRGQKQGNSLETAPDTEIIPGWKYATTKVVSKDQVDGSTTPPELLQTTKPTLKYALVDIGGGFKGVIVEGAASLCDANNPLFQEFLHFRAQQSGDVNPWGDVLVIDSIARKDKDAKGRTADDTDNNKKLSPGFIAPVKEMASKLLEMILSGFSLSNWAWPMAIEADTGKTSTRKVGERGNVVSMMDYRAFLQTKYICKRADVEGKQVRLLAQLDAEPFLTVKSHNQPRREWLDAIKESGQSIVLPVAEGILGTFSQKHKLDVSEMSGFVKSDSGGKFPDFMSMFPGGKRSRREATGSSSSSDWTKSALFKDWGDSHLCDEIQLDELTAAQAMAALDESSRSGVDIGLELIANVGSNLSYPEMAGKLLESVEKKQDEPPGNALDALGTTDLLGGVSAMVKGGLQKKRESEAKSPPAKKAGGGGSGDGGGKVSADAQASAAVGDDGDGDGDDDPEQKGRSMGAGQKGKPAGRTMSAEPPPKQSKQQQGKAVPPQPSSPPKQGRGVQAPPPPPPPPSPRGGRGRRKRATTKKGRSHARRSKSGKPGRTMEEDEEAGMIGGAENIPGWRTQHRDLKPNATLSDSGLIYYGLGNCKQEGVPPLSLFESNYESDVINYYLKVLRIDCMANAREKIMDLFNNGFLVFGGDANNYFDVKKDPKLNEQRLTPEEIRKLSLAFELSAFSKTYHELRKKGFPTSGVINEPNTNISRSVGFLTELSLYYIQRARKVSPAHSVRLTRNLLRTLRTVLTKLSQDAVILEDKCKDCSFDQAITAGDKFRIVCLIEFIVHGMGPFEKGEKQLKPSFYSFIKLNKDGIKMRITEFETHFPKK